MVPPSRAHCSLAQLMSLWTEPYGSALPACSGLTDEIIVELLEESGHNLTHYSKCHNLFFFPPQFFSNNSLKVGGICFWEQKRRNQDNKTLSWAPRFKGYDAGDVIGNKGTHFRMNHTAKRVTERKNLASLCKDGLAYSDRGKTYTTRLKGWIY